MLSREKAYDLIDKVVAASNYEVVVSMNFVDNAVTRFANSEIHQNMASVDTQISITLFDGEKMATSVTNVLTEAAVLEALKSTELKLPFLKPSGMYFEPLKDVPPIESEQYDPNFEGLWDIEKRAEILAEQINALPLGFMTAGAFELSQTAYAWGNSHGVKRYANGSQVHLEVMVTFEDGASGFSDMLIKEAAKLDVKKAFEHALQKAQLGRDAVVKEPGAYTVVLEPQAVNELINFLGYIGSNSKFHIDGMSPFVGKMGHAISVPELTLEDACQTPGMIGLPFDYEGYERQPLKVIDKGIFSGIAYDTITATKHNVKTTGHSLGYRGEGGIPLNLVMQPGNESLEALIKGVDRGLLVSRFHYMNVVDPTTGILTALTRDGLFEIENGKVTKPVKNLRFTDSLPRILNAITGIGDELSILPSFMGSNCVTSLRIEDFNFSGGTTL